MRRPLLGFIAFLAGTLLLAGLFAPGGALTGGSPPMGNEPVIAAQVYVAGDKGAANTNWLVSAIHFNLHGGNDRLVDSVQFGVTGGTPSSVSITLNARRRPWYTCALLSGTTWICPTTGPTQATVQAVSLLGVQIAPTSCPGVGVQAPRCTGTVSIAQAGMEGDLAIRPGDWIAAGYAIAVHGVHSEVHVRVSNIQITLPYTCADGRSGTIVIGMPDVTYTVLWNRPDWLPTGDPANHLGFEGVVLAPSGCGSSTPAMLNSQAAFTATVTWDDVTVTPTLRFHYRDPRAKGFSNIDCASSGANPRSGPACAAAWSSAYQPR